MNENLTIYIKNSLKLIGYFWGLLIIGLLHIQFIDNMIVDQIGYEIFAYAYYFLPILLLWLCTLLHVIGLAGLMPVIIMDFFLVYNGYTILNNAWLAFKPVILSYDYKYIWDTILIQENHHLACIISGVVSLLVVVGSMQYLKQNKDFFKFDLEARKHKKKPKHKNPYGSAKLATPKGIEKVSDRNGFVVGSMPKSPIDTYDIEKSKKKLLRKIGNKLIKLPFVHAIIIAASRVGKGAGILIPNILDWLGGVLVLDPKPEIVHITKRHRESKGQKVFVFDPENRSGLANCYINVLDYLDYDDSEKLLRQIIDLSEMLCPAPANATESNMHFIKGGRRCLRFMLLFMINAEVPEGQMHLGTLYDMLTMSNKEFMKALASASKSDTPDGALARAANAILTTAGNEFSGVINTARDCLDFTECPYNRKVISKSNVTLKDFCIDTNDFYICTEITIDNKPNLLTQFLTIYIFSAIKDDGKKHSKKDRLMVLDELPALGYLGFVDNALTLGAGYGMKIVGVFQSMEKAQTTYPNSWRTFFKSSLVIFINADADEAIYVSDRIHKTTINVESESTGTSEQSNQGQIAQNTSQQAGTTQSSSERHLLTPSEISSLGKKIIVAFTTEECSPIICRRINYWEDPNYKGKFDPNPLQK